MAASGLAVASLTLGLRSETVTMDRLEMEVEGMLLLARLKRDMTEKEEKVGGWETMRGSRQVRVEFLVESAPHPER